VRKRKRAQAISSSQVTPSSSTSNQINISTSHNLSAGSLQTECSLIQTISEESKANAFARAEEERKQKTADKEKETKIQFHRLDLLYDRSKLGDSESANEFLETARNVVIDWKSNRAFYPQRDRVIILYKLFICFFYILKKNFLIICRCFHLKDGTVEGPGENKLTLKNLKTLMIMMMLI